jgi:hypothetical protein
MMMRTLLVLRSKDPLPETKQSIRRYSWLLLALLCSASMYLLWNKLPRNFVGADALPSAVRTNPLTDLFQPWYASREVWLHHRDPYGPEVTHEIQFAFFGHELPEEDFQRTPAESHDARFARAYRFAYPLYVVFLFAPTIGLQFHQAQILVRCLLLVITILSVALWVRVICAKILPPELIVLLAVFLTSFPMLQGIKLIQPGLFVAGLIAGAAFSTVRGWLFLAGAFLALSTVKPQLALLPILWFALWVLADLRERRSLAWGFAFSMALLLLASTLLQPAWLLRFPGILSNYAKDTGGASLVEMLLPRKLAWISVVLASLITAMFCWRLRRSSAKSGSFLLGLALAMNLTVLITPTVVAAYNQVFLLPAALLVVCHFGQLRERGFVLRTAALALSTIALLPWLLATIVAALRIGEGAWPQGLAALAAISVLAFPFATFGLLLLLCACGDVSSSELCSYTTGQIG